MLMDLGVVDEMPQCEMAMICKAKTGELVNQSHPD